MQTLKEVLPPEAFDEARKQRGIQLANQGAVVVEHKDGCDEAWPGTHQNVMHWWIVELNGKRYAAGFNESPSHGWGYPAMRI